MPGIRSGGPYVYVASRGQSSLAVITLGLDRVG